MDGDQEREKGETNGGVDCWDWWNRVDQRADNEPGRDGNNAQEKDGRETAWLYHVEEEAGIGCRGLSEDVSCGWPCCQTVR